MIEIIDSQQVLISSEINGKPGIHKSLIQPDFYIGFRINYHPESRDLFIFAFSVDCALVVDQDNSIIITVAVVTSFKKTFDISFQDLKKVYDEQSPKLQIFLFEELKEQNVFFQSPPQMHFNDADLAEGITEEIKRFRAEQ